jgi:hypothetical protein
MKTREILMILMMMKTILMKIVMGMKLLKHPLMRKKIRWTRQVHLFPMLVTTAKIWKKLRLTRIWTVL